MEILVMGDKDHPRATCVDWMAPWPNIEEFDLVIVTLNTLTQEIFDKIPFKLKEFRSQFFTVFRTGRPVWCIIEKLMLPSPPKTGPKGYVAGYAPPTNYDWLFVYPTINPVLPGSSIQVVDNKFAPYAERVKQWNLEIENIYTLELQAGLERPVEAIGVVLEPLLENKSGKMIGGRIISVSPEAFGEDGSVCLLPQPSDTHEGIETLIDMGCGQERLEPEWRSKVEIPGIDAVEKQISKLELDFKQQMGTLQLKRSSLDKYRDLFSAHEEPQLDAVTMVLSEIGFETQRTIPGFPVDLLGRELAVEVTSITGKVDSNSPKMFQLTKFFEKHRKKEKVVLIANTYKREIPSNRAGKEDFTPPVREYLKLKEVCAMTCVTLFELWKLSKKDQLKARKLVFETNGELKL